MPVPRKQSRLFELTIRSIESIFRDALKIENCFSHSNCIDLVYKASGSSFQMIKSFPVVDSSGLPVVGNFANMSLSLF